LHLFALATGYKEGAAPSVRITRRLEKNKRDIMQMAGPLA